MITITVFELLVVFAIAFLLGMVCAFVIVLDSKTSKKEPDYRVIERRRR